ncbi:MAG: Cna B-type domain-containing protein [Coriobacteriia bacterium]|nr:Cna B-type domain-containing protein [Coriobacteriia bacterium]
MNEERQHNRYGGRIVTLVVSFVLSLVLLLTVAMTALAWSDFTQSYTNTFKGTVAKAAVVLHKYGKNQRGDILRNPVAGAEFLLYRVGTGGSLTQVNGLYTTDSSGKISVGSLSTGNYVFAEQIPGYGYDFDRNASNGNVLRYPFTVTAGDVAVVTPVQVEAYNRRQPGELDITKTVVNANGAVPSSQEMSQEFEFTVNFVDGGTYGYRIDGGPLTQLQSGGTLKLTAGQTAVFADVPVGLYYEVYEKPVSGFNSSSSGNTGNITKDIVSHAHFINTFGQTPAGATRITVKKVVEGEIPASEKNRNFGFNLYVNNNAPVHFTLQAGQQKTFDLNAGDVYRITEDDPYLLGYIQSSVINGAGTATSSEFTVTVTDTYVATVLTTISGTKTWDLRSDPAAKMPTSITVQLLANGKVVQTAAVTPNASGKWTYSFSAPKYDATGKAITYTVSEAPVTNFKATVTGTNIKNTWVKPTPPPKPEEVIISGAKTWRHGSNPVVKRPTLIVVNAMDGNTIVATDLITESDGWMWTFKLPKTRANGKVINYTISEDPVFGYSTKVNGYNLTNTYIGGGGGGTTGGGTGHGGSGGGSTTGGAAGSGGASKETSSSGSLSKTGDDLRLNILWYTLLIVLFSSILLVLLRLLRRKPHKHTHT